MPNWNDILEGAVAQFAGYDGSWNFKVFETKTFAPATKDSIFEFVYRENCRTRYSNRGYDFVDPKIQAEFRQWVKALPKERSHKLFYGNGTVD